MNDASNYAALIDDIFGNGTAKFKKSNNATNNVIGALNVEDDYSQFKSNFTKRLQRLKDIYTNDPPSLKEIINQVNRIAGNNWQSAFSELASLDHFNKDILNRRSYIYAPIKPCITVPVSKTLGDGIVNKETNLDGCVEDCDVFFDVKVLKDIIKDLLEGIYRRVSKHFGIKSGLNIEAEYGLDMSYEMIESKRDPLYKELITRIDINKKHLSFRSEVIPDLSYRIILGQGILTAERTYDPYCHAANSHTMVFKHAGKFLTDSPTLLVYVIFPWYNNVISDFSNANRNYYRAFSRRVFCQYLHDKTSFKKLYPSYTGNKTIFEVSQYLSGIVFIEDNTILSEDPLATNTHSFVYLNPNAKNSLCRLSTQNFLRHFHNKEYDEFDCDNY